MSWVAWVLTANTSRHLPAPLLSRCPPIRLRDLAAAELDGFIRREGTNRGLLHLDRHQGRGSGRSPHSGFLRSTVGAVVRSWRNIAMRLTSTVVVDDPASALVKQTALLGRRRKLYYLTIQRSFVR